MVVLNFIKSLFMPREMVRHRFMPILVAICLFVCSSYLLLLPARHYYLHNAGKLVDKENIYSLQSIRDIKTSAPVNADILDFEEEITSKGIYTINRAVTASKLGLYSIEVSNDFLGYIEKKDGCYYYNGEETDIIIDNTEKDYPTVTTLDGKIVIDGVNDKPINNAGVLATDEIKVLKISLVSSNSHLEVDGVDSGINISSDKVTLSKEENKLLVNGILTNTVIDSKTIIYFVPRSSTYYERSISYVNESGVKQNITFIVDLTKNYVSSSPFTVDSYECDYLNQDYYFVLIYKEAVFYQAHLVGINDKNVERNGKALQCQAYNISTTKLPFNINELIDTDFASYLYDYVVSGYISIQISNFSIIALIYLVGFTLVFSLLFSFIFRKAGRMKKFKEYYNIASIANIIPLLITFIVMWINPGLFGIVYLSTFAIYYLFVLYRINNSPTAI